MLTGGLIGTAIADVLFVFEFLAAKSASRGRAMRRHVKSVDLDQSERARMRNLGWFCVQLPLICAVMGVGVIAVAADSFRR